MPGKKGAEGGTGKPTSGFTAEERAAVRARAKELKAQASRAEEEKAALTAIAAMGPADRVLGERIHALIKTHAPVLTAKTWYGMPAYSKGEDVVCFFKPAGKFKTRYATLGFSDSAMLDDGSVWATEFAITRLGAADEARIVALLRKAIG